MLISILGVADGRKLSLSKERQLEVLSAEQVALPICGAYAAKPNQGREPWVILGRHGSRPWFY
jgi:hypothetical protein